MSAELNTRADGVALDHLILREAATHAAVAAHRLAALEHALHAAINGTLDVGAAVERWRTRHAPRRMQPHTLRPRHAPVVHCNNELAESTTVIEVRASDEHGLAYRIASALTDCALDITCAKIATEKADALDVFGIHGAGGTLGALLTGVFATRAVNPIFKAAPVGLADGHAAQLVNQLVGVALAMAIAVIGSFVLLKLVDWLVGLRVSAEDELTGLDLTQHGEEGYELGLDMLAGAASFARVDAGLPTGARIAAPNLGAQR